MPVTRRFRPHHSRPAACAFRQIIEPAMTIEGIEEGECVALNLLARMYIR
jgi:hypothetical protein